MSVSKNLINILNSKKSEELNIKNVSDLIVTWNRIQLNDCYLKDRIKSEKERLIRFSDHEDDEDMITLLMDLEVNQDDHKHNREVLERKVGELNQIIEYLVDNYEIDIREVISEFDKNRSLPFTKRNEIVTEEIWSQATKQRRRENRLGKLLD